MNRRTLLAGLAIILAPNIVLAQGAPANPSWYNGDCRSGIPGQSNWYFSDQMFSRTFDNFDVPSGGWTVASVFSLNAMSGSTVTEAAWEIRSGVSRGNGGTVVASGRSPATQTLLFTWPDGERIYRIEVDGLAAQLAPGSYWLNVSPVITEWSPAMATSPSYVCATTGTGAAGTPPGNDGNAYYYSTAANVFFQAVRNTGDVGSSGDFSQGILTSTGSRAAAAITSVVNAASWQSGAVSPGELVTITGTALGPSAPASLMLDQTGKVSSSLNGVRVSFSGIAAPQTYVSSGQINAVVPYELAGVASPAVQVQVAGQTSNAFPLTLTSAAPALFTSSGSGTGPAAALNQDNSYNGPTHPAAKGSYVVLFVTGEGLTNSCVTGKITTVSPTPPLTPQPLISPVTVQIGGQPASVAFYGEAPGLVSGVMQINVQIPANAPSGNLPISVSLAGAATQSGVTISVQ
jgi:uncharacterized protein (TIGR03437 family)